MRKIPETFLVPKLLGSTKRLRLGSVLKKCGENHPLPFKPCSATNPKPIFTVLMSKCSLQFHASQTLIQRKFPRWILKPGLNKYRDYNVCKISYFMAKTGVDYGNLSKLLFMHLLWTKLSPDFVKIPTKLVKQALHQLLSRPVYTQPDIFKTGFRFCYL